MSVALLHTGRVGSTVVAKQLEQHPDLTWDGEVFERLIDYRYRQQKADFEELLAEGLTPEELIRARMVVCSTNNYGLEIKVHPDQHLKKGVMNKNIKECVSMLSSIGFSKFIFLHRKNYLRQRISATVAAVQNQYFRQTKKAQLSRVEIKPQSDSSDGETFLLQEFETMDRVGSEVRREISSKDSLILSYEEDVLSDPRIAYSKICDYVGIRKVESKVTLKRTNPFKVSNMVVNYESVKRMLRGSKYEWMLDGK
jgi:LPS sulfotransferase NodH